MTTARAFTASLAALLAMAQQAPPAAAQTAEPGESPALLLEPILITGLKGDDPVQEIPAGVTVLFGDGRAFDSLEPGPALTRAAPNFYFGGFSQPGVDFTTMRGVGPLGQPSNSLDNSVGVSTNGAATSAFGFPPSLLDVERVEVIRGPQGTLFGRNALGGAVNVVTRPADGIREFRLRGEVGTDGHLMGEAVAAGTLIDGKLAGRFAARLQRTDGDYPNLVAGGEEGALRLGAARGALRLTPQEDLRIDLTLGFDREKRASNYNMLLEAPNFPTSGADLIPDNGRARAEATLEIRKDFDAASLTSLTNLQRIRLDGLVDTADDLVFQRVYGFTPPHGADLAESEDVDRIFSQELRLNSPEGAPVKWVAGVNYFRSDYESFRRQDSSYSPYSSGDFDTRLASDTLAVFGDATLPVTERLKLSGGLRLSHDRQKLDVVYEGRGFPGSAARFEQASGVSDDYLTGRLALSYDWSDALMSYASVSRGYASGGFPRYTLNAAVGEETAPFRPSSGWSYEAGVKADFAGGRAALSAAAFYNDVSDGQLATADMGTSPITFRFVNQDYAAYGFELEGRIQATPALRLSAGLGATATRLGDVTETAALGARKGGRVPNSPEFSASLEAEYRFLENFALSARYQYVGERAMDIGNTGDLPPEHRVDAKLGWSDGKWEVYGFVENLFDERPLYFGSTYGPEAHSVAVGAGRKIGLGLGVSF